MAARVAAVMSGSTRQRRSGRRAGGLLGRLGADAGALSVIMRHAPERLRSCQRGGAATIRAHRLAQQAAQHLAGRADRQLGAELDLARRLVARQALLAKGDELRFTHLRLEAVLQYDAGLDGLA